jgi:coniferyl-aldehyde dehydrogenase
MRDLTQDLTPLFDRLHAATRAQVFPDAATRIDRLDRVEKLLRAHEAEFVAAISADFAGRSDVETRLAEFLPCLESLKHARRHLRRWMRPRRVWTPLTMQPARAWVQDMPLGVVGVIAPWNYPLMLSISPLIDALAAGNRVMIKPSELTPQFSDLLAARVAQYFAPDEVAVATGGPDVAAAFAALPFDHLLFTGSTRVGRLVAQAAAPNLTPVTLELGGKSPVIIAPGYPLDKAARAIALGKFINAGQTCIAPDYVLVPRGQGRALAQAVLAAAARGYPAITDNPDMTAIITPRHRARLVQAVDEARAAGAEVLSHADQDCAPRMAPTVVLNPPASGILADEEIFGPVLPVIEVDTLDAAIAHVNARPRPLALYVFSDRRAEVDGVLQNTVSGGVTVNGTLLHVANHGLPFGGVGPSGTGAYHGIEGFRRLSHARAVHKVGFVNPVEWMGPPWGRRVQALLRVVAGLGR